MPDLLLWFEANDQRVPKLPLILQLAQHEAQRMGRGDLEFYVFAYFNLSQQFPGFSKWKRQA